MKIHALKSVLLSFIIVLTLLLSGNVTADRVVWRPIYSCSYGHCYTRYVRVVVRGPGWHRWDRWHRWHHRDWR